MPTGMQGAGSGVANLHVGATPHSNIDGRYCRVLAVDNWTSPRPG